MFRLHALRLNLHVSHGSAGSIGPVHTISYDDGIYDENLSKAKWVSVLSSSLSTHTFHTKHIPCLSCLKLWARSLRLVDRARNYDRVRN